MSHAGDASRDRSDVKGPVRPGIRTQGAEHGEPETAWGTGAVHAVVERQDGAAECTLYPDGVDGVSLMSRWITAEEGSFVGLAEMR